MKVGLKDKFRLLDNLAANAWPAEVQEPFEGWRLRANGGVTRRANSVLAAAPMPTHSEWLEQIEEFYRSRQLPPRFHVSDASPDGLGSLLEDNGYQAEAQSMVQAARATLVAERAAALKGLTVTTSTAVTEEWLDAYIAVEEAHAGMKSGYQAIYSAILLPAYFVRALDESGRTNAVGLAVTERGWTGLFSIGTLPQYRGRGLATHILSILAQWSLSCGAPNLYLQVMEDNSTAVRLYEKLGFSRLYGYHYRTKWAS